MAKLPAPALSVALVFAGALTALLLPRSSTLAEPLVAATPSASAPTPDSPAAKWEKTAAEFAGDGAPGASRSIAKIDPCRDVVMRFVFATEVAEVLVKGGERVKQGQLLAKARDADIVAAVEQQRLVANSDLETQGAKANMDLAAFRFEQLKIGKVFTPEDFERARAESITTRVQYEQSLLNVKVQKTRLDQLVGQYERYRLEAPFDGIVENVMIEVGKGVGENVDALRIVNTDNLWLDAYPDTDLTMRLRLDKGSPAWVLINLPDKPALVEGKVLYVSPAADYVGQTRRVRVEIPNPANLPAGLQGSVRFTQPTEHWMQFLARPDPAQRGTTTSQTAPAHPDSDTASSQAFASPQPNAAVQERSK